MEKLHLSATKRTIVGRKVKTLRKQGQVPANIYGKKVKSTAVTVDAKAFSGVFAKAGETGLIELKVDTETRPVLVHNVHYHPLTNIPIHIDFFQVDLKEKVTAHVPFVFVGEAQAVKDKVGVLLTLLSEIEVEALPADLPEKIEVDVTHLKEIGDVLKIGDLKVSDKVKLVTLAESDIVKVAPLVSKEAEKMAQEQAAAAAAAAAAAVPTTEGTVAPTLETKSEAPTTPEK